MAGGKETPRQKMIGMMYLVLTALLALNVSSAILEKFAIINATLEQLKANVDGNNEKVVAKIVEGGSKSPKPEVQKAIEDAKTVRQLTKTTITEIENLKKKFYADSNTDKVDGGLINNHGSGVATMMIDKNSVEGPKLEKMLNDYVDKVSALCGKKLDKIAKAPKEIDVFKGDEDHIRKSFLEFNFENTPPIGAVATVTQFQTEVLAREEEALAILAVKADVGSIKLDTFTPIVIPKSSIVAAGAKYEGQMLLTGSSSAISPEFFMGATKLPVIEGGKGVKMGKIEFTASGGGYDAQGLAKKSFKAEIRMAGQDPFVQDIEYFVAQPVIKVTTGNAPTLYMNCGNTVNIEVPALGTNYNPSFSCSGAEIRKGAKAGQVTIIPSQRKISVAVANGGTAIGSQPFDVKNIPEPRFVAYVGSTPVDLRQGITATQLRTLRIVVEPDANFKEEVPKDARYNIKNMEVLLGSGPSPKARMSASNGSPDLGAWGGQAKAGDRVVFDIKDASRKTFTDSEEKVPVKGSNGIIIVQIK